MPFRPNYRFERAERDRAKQAKKAEKLLRRRQQRDAPPDQIENSDDPANPQDRSED